MHDTQVVLNDRVPGEETRGVFEARECRIETSEMGECHAAAAMGNRQVGPQGRGRLVLLDGLLEAPEVTQRLAEIRAYGGIPGLQLDGLDHVAGTLLHLAH